MAGRLTSDRLKLSDCRVHVSEAGRIAEHSQTATFLIDPDAGRKLARQMDLALGLIFAQADVPADSTRPNDRRRLENLPRIKWSTMATRTRNGNGQLANAMALLLNNQAALVAQHTRFMSEMAETRKEFAEIRKDLDTIKAVLIRHEAMLEKLPEAIREKIGFKQ
jgi:hypothetical protein